MNSNLSSLQINFIKHLSDEVIEENHALKNDIIKARKELKSFQESIIEQLTNIGEQITTFDTPKDCLTYFVRKLNKWHRESKEKQVHLQNQRVQVSSLRDKLVQVTEKLQTQHSGTKQLQQNHEQAEKRLKSTIKSHVDKIAALEQQKAQLAQKMKEMNIAFEGTIQLLKKQNTAHLQLLKNQHKTELLHCTNRLQKDFSKSQALLKTEIKNKDKSLSEMMLSLKKLLESRNEETGVQGENIKELLEMMQMNKQNEQALQTLRKDNSSLRGEIRSLEKDLLEKQLKLAEFHVREQNNMKKIEQLIIDKLALEANLLYLTKIQQQAEKDKQALDLYYDEKWKSEFKRVNKELSKQYKQFQKAAQDEFKQKEKVLDIQADNIRQEIGKIEIKLINLEEQLEVISKEKNVISEKLNQKQKQAEQLQRQAQELAGRSFEEIQLIKINHHEEHAKILAANRQLQLDLNQSQKSTLEYRLKHKSELENIHKHFELLLIADKQNQLREKERTAKIHLEELQKWQRKLDEQRKRRDQALQECQKQSDSLLKQEQQRFNEKIDNKQKAHLAQLDKVRQKYREYQFRITSQKKKYQAECDLYKQKIKCLEKRFEETQVGERELQKAMMEFETIKRDYKAKIRDLEKTVEELNNQIRQNNNQISSLNKQIEITQRQLEINDLRKKQWLQSLNNLECEFRREFNELRQTQEKHLFFYKSRIWQLQGIAKKKYIQEKDIEKLQLLVHEKELLQDSLHVKQAENLILNQVKKYYESKFRMTQSKSMIKEEDCQKLVRKSIRNQFYLNTSPEKKETPIFEFQEIKDMKKYIRSARRNQLNIFKQPIENTRYKRVNTSY